MQLLLEIPRLSRGSRINDHPSNMLSSISLYYIYLSYCTSLLLAASADVKLKVTDIAILHLVLLSLLAVFSFSLHSVNCPQLHEILVLHNFSTDKALLEICVNHSRCLGSLRSGFDCPASHFILTSCEEVN